MLFAGLLSQAYAYLVFLYSSRLAQGMVLPSVDLALVPQLTIKTTPTDMPEVNLVWVVFQLRLPSQTTLAWLKLVFKAN